MKEVRLSGLVTLPSANLYGDLEGAFEVKAHLAKLAMQESMIAVNPFGLID
jgi:hypothetical protein